MNKFFATAAGGYVKLFLSGMLGWAMSQYADKPDIFTWDVTVWKTAVSFAISSGIIIMWNALNPKYVQYGRGKTQELVDKTVDKIQEDKEAKDNK